MFGLELIFEQTKFALWSGRLEVVPMDAGRKTTPNIHEDAWARFSMTKANAAQEACVLLLPAIGRRTSPVLVFPEEPAHLRVIWMLGREHHERGTGILGRCIEVCRDISTADICVLLSDAGSRTC